LLDENDLLWPKLRHMHIADCIRWVVDSFNEFMRTNTVVKMQKQGKKTETGLQGLKQIGAAMKAMPQYQEMFAQYSLHIRLASECMDLFKKLQLEAIGNIEQNLATNEGPTGEKIKPADNLQTLRMYIADDSVRNDVRMRLLLIYLISQEGVSQKEREELIKAAGFSDDENKVFENIKQVGVNFDKKDKGFINMRKKFKEKKSKKDNKKDNKKDKKKETKDNKNKKDDVPYDISRYMPLLKDLIEDLRVDQLSKSEFPYCGEEPKSSAAKPKNKPVSLKSDRKGDAKRERKAAEAMWAKDKKKSFTR